jgi:type IV secretory pathway VirB2 component (pilin)
MNFRVLLITLDVCCLTHTTGISTRVSYFRRSKDIWKNCTSRRGSGTWILTRYLNEWKLGGRRKCLNAIHLRLCLVVSCFTLTNSSCTSKRTLNDIIVNDEITVAYSVVVIIIIVIGSTALYGPWPFSEASASWSVQLLLLQILWQESFPGWGFEPHAQFPAILEGRCFLSGLFPLAD